jgi:hypothetical protein
MVGKRGDENPDRVSFFEAHNLPTDNPYTNANVMAATARQSTTENPMFHFSMNWPEEEKPSIDTQREVAKQIMQRFTVRDKLNAKGVPDEYKQFDEYQWQVFGHKDRPHTHFHIQVNRVHPETGRAADVGMFKNKMREIGNELEREHGWRIVTHERDEDQSRTITRDEHYMNERKGADYVHLTKGEAKALAQALRERISESESWVELDIYLGSADLSIQPKGARGHILVNSKGEYAKWSEVAAKGVTVKKLEEAYGQTFADYEQEKAELEVLEQHEDSIRDQLKERFAKSRSRSRDRDFDREM